MITVYLQKTHAGNWTWGYDKQPVSKEALKRRGTCMSVCAAHAIDHFKDQIENKGGVIFEVIKHQPPKIS